MHFYDISLTASGANFYIFVGLPSRKCIVKCVVWPDEFQYFFFLNLKSLEADIQDIGH